MAHVSVIISVYNKDRPDWVRLSVDSILNQTYPDIKIYIGVDGPVDKGLEEIIDGYSNKDTITIIRFSKNRGLACVLNDLLDICFREECDYIARMDADDVSLPDRFEKQIRFLESNNSIDVVGGSIEEIDENGQLRNKKIIYPSEPYECYKFFSRRNPHAHPAVMFRRSFFQKLDWRKYRPEYRQNQDTMLWYDGMMAGTQHANIPDVVLMFRVTDTMFKKRRSGWSFAKKQLSDRLMINKNLGYKYDADVFAYLMFLLLISPSWVKRVAYRLFR